MSLDLVRAKHSKQSYQKNDRGYLQIVRPSSTQYGAVLYQIQVVKTVVDSRGQRKRVVFERFNDASGGVFFGDESYSLHRQQLEPMSARKRLTWEWTEGNHKKIYKISSEGFLFTTIGEEEGDPVHEVLPVSPGELLQQLHESFSLAEENRTKVIPA